MTTARSVCVLADDTDSDAAAAPESWIALLPSLDPTIMGWTARDWYLGPHRPALFDRNGNAGSDDLGRRPRRGRLGPAPDGEVVTRLLEDVGGEVRPTPSPNAPPR